MPESKRPLKVFLCHAHTDLPVVRNLYKRLKNDGINVWFDDESILGGQDWRNEKYIAIRNSDVIIVCLSKQSITKEGIFHAEIRLALEKAYEKPEGTIFIIPLRLEECEVPDQIRRWRWVDLFEPDGYERLISALQARSRQINARDAKV